MPDFSGQFVDMGLGMITNAADRFFQIDQQKKLTAQQVKAMKEMGQFNYEKQMQLWKETNYPAQVGMMKEAGLNPGLMYKGAGPGGTTAFAGGGGVTGGTAGMELGNQILQRAQIRLMESQANKLDVEAKKTAGVDTDLAQTQIASLTQGIENQKAVKELTEIQTSIAQIEDEIKGYTQNAAKSKIMTEARYLTAQMHIIERNNKLDESLMDEKIEMMQAELAGVYARNELARAQTGLAGAQITNMVEQIKVAYAQIAQAQSETEIRKQLADFETSFGGQAAKVLGDIIGLIPGLRGKKSKTTIEHTGGQQNTTIHKRQ